MTGGYKQSDTSPANWFATRAFTLIELLRVIAMFAVGGYAMCLAVNGCLYQS